MRGVLVTLAVLFLTGTSERGSGDGLSPTEPAAPRRWGSDPELLGTALEWDLPLCRPQHAVCPCRHPGPLLLAAR